MASDFRVDLAEARLLSAARRFALAHGICLAYYVLKGKFRLELWKEMGDFTRFLDIDLTRNLVRFYPGAYDLSGLEIRSRQGRPRLHYCWQQIHDLSKLILQAWNSGSP